MQPGFFQRDGDSAFRFLAFGESVLGLAKVAPQNQKDRLLFLDRVFGFAMKGSATAGGETVKIYRSVAGLLRPNRLVEILLEIAPAGTQDAQPKIIRVVGRHAIPRLPRVTE